MKRSLSSLLMSVLFVSSAFAQTYHDKTFLALRPATANAARTLTTWHNHVKDAHEDRFGGSLSATGFYSRSTNAAALGKYFGSNKTAVFNGTTPVVINDYISVDASSNSADLSGEDLFHDGYAAGFTATNGTTAEEGGVDKITSGVDQTGLPNSADRTYQIVDKLVLRPNVQRWGVELAYNQHLDKLLKGLSFRVVMPIEDVRTSMNAKTATGVTAVGAAAAAGNLLGTATVQNYLAGQSVVTGQDVLKSAKIDNAGHSKAGVADISAQLQYQLWEQDGHAIALNVGAVFPTGSKTTGEFRFEPQVGARGHWGVGAGLDARFRLWHGEEERSLDLLAVANYRYLLSGTEKRTPNHNVIAFYEYGIVGQVNTLKLQPAANVLTQDFNVTPGSQLDVVAKLSLGLGNWTLDAGYNLYYADAETSKARNVWADNTYAYADYAYSPVANGVRGADGVFALGYAGNVLKIINAGASAPFTASNSTLLTLNSADIAWKSVNNPSQLTHSVFGGVGYSFNEMETPVHLGLGGSFEFVSTNAAAESWSVWGKVGISF